MIKQMSSLKLFTYLPTTLGKMGRVWETNIFLRLALEKEL
jgi:hypothetical protein